MKKIFLLIALLTANLLCFGQQGNPVQNFSYWYTLNVGKGAQVNTDPSAWLEIGNLHTTKAILLPRVDSTGAIVSPKMGDFVIVNKAGDTSLYYYSSKWVKLLTTSGSDNQTLSLDASDNLSISNGNSVVLPYTRSVVFLDSIQALRAAIGSGATTIYNRYGSIIHSGDSVEVDTSKVTSVYQNSLKLNKGDTTAMLVPYLRKGDSTVKYITLTQLQDSLNAHPGSVVSVNGQTGIVTLTTTNIAEGSNKYFTDVRVYNDSVIYLAYVKTLIAGKVGYGDTSTMLFPYLTKAVATSTYVPLSMVIPINKGGTGQTTANAAFNALAPSQTSHAGQILTTDGSNTNWGALSYVGTVGNIDGSLNVAPTSGDVIVAINTSHSNSWQATQTFQGITIEDGYNISLGTTTGTKIGTSSSQPLGFLGATPVLQQSGDVGTAMVANGLMSSASYDYASITGIPNFVTGLSVATTHGFGGSFTTGSTPTLTINTTVTGILKGNAASGTISTATAGTDYTVGMSALATGIVKNTTGTGTPSIAVAGDFPALPYVSSVQVVSNATAYSVTPTSAVTSSGIYSIVPTGSSSQFVKGNGTLDGTTYLSSAVTSIATTAPLSGGTITGTGTIAISKSTTSTDGYLSSADWNTFNSKGLGSVTSIKVVSSVSSFSFTPTFAVTSSGTYSLVATGNGTKFVKDDGTSATAITSIATSAPLSGGTITGTGTLSITKATTSTDGYLSATDWTTFNNKGSGTVTSLQVVSNAVAFSVTPTSTITSSGIYSIIPTGASGQFVRGDGTLGTSVSGTVTSVGLVGSSTMSVTGTASPITGSGTYTLTVPASSIGTVNLSATGTPSTTTYLRGDNTWGTPSGGSGTVTSVAIAVPTDMAVSGSPVTTSGTITLSHAGLNTITDAANFVFNGSNGSTQVITLGANRTFTISNLLVGVTYRMIVNQDGTGSRVLTWGTTVKAAWGYAGTPPISTAASAQDVYELWTDGTTIHAKVDLNWN